MSVRRVRLLSLLVVLLWAPALWAHPRATLPEPAGPDGLASWWPLLIVALGLGGAGLLRRARFTLGVPCALTVFVVFLLGTTPHLVHHLFDRDQGADCQGLQAVERSQAAHQVALILPAPVSAAFLSPEPARLLPAPAVPAARGRSPPG